MMVATVEEQSEVARSETSLESTADSQSDQGGRFISVSELKGMFSIEDEKAYELVHMKNFPSRKIGGVWRIDREKLIDQFHEAPKEVKDITQLWK